MKVACGTSREQGLHGNSLLRHLKEGAIGNVVFFVTDSFNSYFLSFKLQIVTQHLQELRFLIFCYF